SESILPSVVGQQSAQGCSKLLTYFISALLLYMYFCFCFLPEFLHLLPCGLLRNCNTESF
uniref:Uncharacterized protein n=1 Tax=Scleropages formosus TaxID=113540 RepID=A0A8C9T2Y2_SCLFO